MPDAPPGAGRSIRALGTAVRASRTAAAAHSVRWHLALLIAVCGLLFLTGAGSLPLIDQEEARCAQIVREMIRSGNWLMPHLLGEPYFDKPAPFFWLAAVGEMLTGNAALGGRLIAALAAALAVLTTYAFGRRTFGAAAGLIAGLVLATSVQFWYMARWYRMDMPFAAAMWAAVAWFWLCEHPAADTARTPKWKAWCGFYLFCGLAVLFKGPAGLGLPVLIIGGYFLLSRRPRRIAEFFDVRGITVFALVVAPWYVAVSIQEPSYAYEFLFMQNVMRFGSGTFGHTWPGILFVPILLLGLIPWTIYLAPAVRSHGPRRWRGGTDQPRTLLLWLAAIVPLVFFMFSKTKIVGYVLPCFPPLAVLVGAVIAEWIDSDSDDRLMRWAAYALVVAVALLWVLAAALEVRFAGVGLGIGVALAGCIATTVLTLRSLRHRRRDAFVAWALAGFGVLLMFVATTIGRDGYERLSARALVELIPATDRINDDFFMWPRTRYSFVYYVDVPEQGRMHHVDRENVSTVAAGLNGLGGVYILVSGEQNLRELQARSPGRVEVVGRTGDLWLVSNHTPGASRLAPARGH